MRWEFGLTPPPELLTRDRRRFLLMSPWGPSKFVDASAWPAQDRLAKTSMAPPTRSVTELLEAWSHGDAGARDRLMPLIYGELHRRAAAYVRRERRGHELQPTALVH